MIRDRKDRVAKSCEVVHTVGKKPKKKRNMLASVRAPCTSSNSAEGLDEPTPARIRTTLSVMAP